jgi:hypothetical protein
VLGLLILKVAVPKAHLYLFSDACPSDWLVGGQDEVWHTIVNLVFQLAPTLRSLIDQGRSHEEILEQDELYKQLNSAIQALLPSNRLSKWKTGPGYRERFCKAFVAVAPKLKPIVSACSFQEKTLRASKQALLQSYNQHIGGIEGRGIGFEEFIDDRGRRQMKHSFVNLHGPHKIEGPEDKMLVLLLMSWFIADQFNFFYKEIIKSGKYGFDGLSLTVVSDRLSGDDNVKRMSEQNLRSLMDPGGESAPLVLTRSAVSDTFSGDLLVDNLAGWLNSAMREPAGECAGYIKNLISTGIWAGWHQLLPSVSKLESVPAVSRLG